MESSEGVAWYAMKQHAEMPVFESGEDAYGYNQAQFREFMPGYERPITTVDGSGSSDGYFEVRHDDGSGTRFYDSTRYSAPRDRYQMYEDGTGGNGMRYTVRLLSSADLYMRTGCRFMTVTV